MQTVTDLPKLRDAVIARVRRLRTISSPMRLPLTPQDNRTLAFVTIEIDNLIINGLKSYTKSSLLRSRTSSGSRITASVYPSTTEEAAALIFKSINPRAYVRNHSPIYIREKDELKIRDPLMSQKVLIDYSTSNVADFALALSLNATVFGEAKICRHFFAHRTQNTHDAVKKFAGNMGVINYETPEKLLLNGRPNTGVRILDGWLSELELFFDLAT